MSDKITERLRKHAANSGVTIEPGMTAEELRKRINASTIISSALIATARELEIGFVPGTTTVGELAPHQGWRVHIARGSIPPSSQKSSGWQCVCRPELLSFL